MSSTSYLFGCGTGSVSEFLQGSQKEAVFEAAGTTCDSSGSSKCDPLTGLFTYSIDHSNTNSMMSVRFETCIRITVYTTHNYADQTELSKRRSDQQESSSKMLVQVQTSGMVL